MTVHVNKRAFEVLIPIEMIDRDPNQPRVQFDERELRDLAQSIRENGLLQAVSVRPAWRWPDGRVTADKEGEMPLLPPQDVIVYTAGLFDGEGSFGRCGNRYNASAFQSDVNDGWNHLTRLRDEWGGLGSVSRLTRRTDSPHCRTAQQPAPRPPQPHSPPPTPP